jgi:hypothetical protein
MKETEIKHQDQIEVSKPVFQQKKHTFLGSVKKQPNMSVFEASLESGDVVPAVMELVMTHEGKQIHQVKFKENHIYCYALNGKNAVRKFEKMLNGRVR